YSRMISQIHADRVSLNKNCDTGFSGTTTLLPSSLTLPLMRIPPFTLDLNLAYAIVVAVAGYNADTAATVTSSLSIRLAPARSRRPAASGPRTPPAAFTPSPGGKAER